MFEWLVLGMLFLCIAYKLGRKIGGKEGIIAKEKKGNSIRMLENSRTETAV